MQQSKNAKFSRYVLSGDRMVLKDEIAVSNHVFVENHGEEDERQAFRAAKEERQKGGIAFKWALPVMILMMMIAAMMVFSKMNLTQELHQEYAQLRNRYQEALLERGELASAFSKKSDASDVCYYAVQNLGMRLATHEETIGVKVLLSRANQLMDVARPSASGAHQ